MTSPRTRPSWLFAAVAAVAALIAVEGMAWAFFALKKDAYPFADLRFFLAEEVTPEKLGQVFDPVLGWRKKPRPATPFGERRRGRDYGRPLVAAFGDSFTFGDEVADDETWAEYLAARLGGDVYNFGGSAYGMDQMLLRFEQERTRRPTPIHLFVFISNDVKRNVTTYRKFMVPSTEFTLVKPRFLLRDRRLELLPNPARSEGELADALGEPVFLRRIGEHDWSYRRYRLPQPPWPRFTAFFAPGFWRAFADRRRPPELWHEGEARRIAEQILLRFHRGSARAGGRPVIVHLPSRTELDAYLADATLPVAVHVTRELCARHALRCLFPLVALGGREPSELETAFRPHGHYAPETNRWLAGYLHERLAEEVPPAPDDGTAQSEAAAEDTADGSPAAFRAAGPATRAGMSPAERGRLKRNP